MGQFFKLKYVTSISRGISVVNCWEIFNNREVCERNSYMRSYHIYKDIWDAVISVKGSLITEVISMQLPLRKIGWLLTVLALSLTNCDMFLNMCMRATVIVHWPNYWLVKIFHVFYFRWFEPVTKIFGWWIIPKLQYLSDTNTWIHYSQNIAVIAITNKKGMRALLVGFMTISCHHVVQWIILGCLLFNLATQLPPFKGFNCSNSTHNICHHLEKQLCNVIKVSVGIRHLWPTDTAKIALISAQLETSLNNAILNTCWNIWAAIWIR